MVISGNTRPGGAGHIEYGSTSTGNHAHQFQKYSQEILITSS